MEKTAQETTSTYFNTILKKSVVPLPVERLDPDLLATFYKAVEQAFGDEAETIKQRTKYLLPYIIQNIDWKEYGIPLEGWQLIYYYHPERFLKVTGLSYDKFLAHEPLQEAIGELGLQPEPVFEFILFLCYYYYLRADLKFSPVEQLEKLQEVLANRDAIAMMDVVVDGKHFKFNNSLFIKNLFKSINKEIFSYGNFKDNFDQGTHRDKVRALDYYLVKTLLDYLPIDPERKKGRFSQAERNFALCVLNLCGRLQGEEVDLICSQFNNATFDKLMRDFKNREIPFAMELFL